MAIPTIQMPSPVRDQPPQREKRDLIDEIMRGLQIAQGISGIAVNTQKFMQEADLAPLKQEKLAAESQVATQQASQLQSMAQDKFEGFSQLSKAGFSQVPMDTEGAFQVQVGEQTVNVLPAATMAQRSQAKIASSEAATQKLKDVAKQKKDFGDFLRGRSDQLTQQLKPVNESIGDINKALGFLDQLDNPNISDAEKLALFSSAKTNVARAVTGPGVLTEMEKKGVLPNTLMMELDRTLKTQIGGELTANDVAGLRAVTNNLINEISGFGESISNNIMSDVVAQAKFFAPNLVATDISKESIEGLLPGSARLVPIRAKEMTAGGPLKSPEQQAIQQQAPQPAQVIQSTGAGLPPIR